MTDGCIGFEDEDLAGDVIGTASGVGTSLMVASLKEPLLPKVSRIAVAVAALAPVTVTAVAAVATLVVVAAVAVQ